jgi:hypothetical protein
MARKRPHWFGPHLRHAGQIGSADHSLDILHYRCLDLTIELDFDESAREAQRVGCWVFWITGILVEDWWYKVRVLSKQSISALSVRGIGVHCTYHCNP